MRIPFKEIKRVSTKFIFSHQREVAMPNTIQPVSPQQNGQAVNNLSQDRSTPKAAEKPPERLDTASNDRPEKAETRKAPAPKKVEANPAEENQPKENPAAENTNPQETQNNQADKQRGSTLDIMA